MRALVYILLLITPLVATASADNTYVMLIGISNFKNKWAAINGANDVRYLQQFYRTCGVPPSQIISLVNETATKQNLLSLAKSSVPATVTQIIVHISTHGIQVTDLNKDEPDGLDEAFVLYETNPIEAYAEANPDFNSFLLDDELSMLLQELRMKNPQVNHITLVLDACHSGTGARDIAIHRGGYPPLGTPSNTSSEAYLYSPENPHLTVLAASAAREPNSEYGKLSIGSLTYCYMEAIKKMNSTGNIAMLALYYQIKAEFKTINIRQNPMLEGNKTAELFENGVADINAPEFEGLKVVNDSTIIISGGNYSFVTPKSIFWIENRPGNKVLYRSTARVVKVGPTTSTIVVEKKLGTLKIEELKITISPSLAATEPLQISTNGLSDELQKFIKVKLPNLQFNSLKEKLNSDVLIENKNGSYSITTKNGDTLYSKGSSLLPCVSGMNEFPEDAVQILHQLHVYKQLLSHYKQSNSSALQSKFTVLKKNDDNTYSTDTPLVDIQLRKSDKCLLQVNNPNMFGGYIYLLIFDPKYCISFVHGSSDEIFIERGSTQNLLIPLSQLDSQNKYSIKLIFSDQPLGNHIGWLINKKSGARDIGLKEGPFDYLSSNTTALQSRGSVVASKNKFTISNFEITVE